MANGVNPRELYAILDEERDDPLNFQRGSVYHKGSFSGAARNLAQFVWAIGKRAVIDFRLEWPDLLARSGGDMICLSGLFALVLSVGLAATALAQSAGSAFPSVKLQVTEATLDNGLRVLVQEDSRNPIVAVQILYRVGSRNELPGATGLAHFLEHLMFKGTPTRGRGEISRLIEQNGGRENAFTTKDMERQDVVSELRTLSKA